MVLRPCVVLHDSQENRHEIDDAILQLEGQSINSFISGGDEKVVHLNVKGDQERNSHVNDG